MEAIIAYFAWLAALGPMALGFIPLDSPIAPPGPEGPRPAIVQRVNGLPVSACPVQMGP